MAAKGTEIGKTSRLTKYRKEREENQKALEFAAVSEENSGKMKKKKVTFLDQEVGGQKSEEHELEKLVRSKTKIMEQITKERNELKKERKKQLELMKEWEKNWEVRTRIIKEKLEKVGNEIREIKEKKEDSERNKMSGRSETDITSKANSYARSTITEASENRLSAREVRTIKNWMSDQEKEKRRKNIVIKGIKDEKELKDIKENPKRWAVFFLKVKLGMEDCKVEYGRVSNRVIIIKMSSEEEKKEVMRNKHKLKGGSIFIGNDLTWEERKTQERIYKWAKEMKEKGEEVKIGIGKARIRGIWRQWKDIEKEIGEDKIKKHGKEKGRKGLREREKIREEMTTEEN